MGPYFFMRDATDDVPSGWTVSKRKKLPKGDFRATEYVWGPTSLWFVDQDNFTEEERQQAYRSFMVMKTNHP